MPLYKESITEAALKQYPILPYKFIDLIKILPKPLPVSLSKFQKIFDYQLRIIKKDNDSETYETGSFRTLDGVIIKKVGVLIYLEKKNQIVGLGIYLDPKQCVNTKLLKKEFDFLIPRLLSFHPVSNAPIAFYTTDENGKFVMGSTMDYPDCATNIGLEAFYDDEEKQEWIKYVREQAPHLQERARKRELEGK
ncbi:unnamed protein product [Commensalibacter communis]|uniref:hypothetical protein n=1 Tax=Commensalibacter communis TaxID=2972786 RepID=UPI0022FF84CF|nr:hypothetical protein [Commensalibacter communis]CAI3952042.1 unnamed protein product [Commensalibacter communis]CAI3952401.1 unnamed protein product [Commensalibacter communis]